MIKTLAIKELRETAWIALLGFALYLLTVAVPVVNSLSNARHQFGGRGLPFLDPEVIAPYTYISIAMALAFGFRQSMGETIGRTFCLLLHCPMDRRYVLLTKIGVGVGLLLLLGAVPLLLYAWWAATPGCVVTG